MHNTAALQHQTLTVRHPDGGMIVPVQYKVEEALFAMRALQANRNDYASWEEWLGYFVCWQQIAISWASR